MNGAAEQLALESAPVVQQFGESSAEACLPCGFAPFVLTLLPTVPQRFQLLALVADGLPGSVSLLRLLAALAFLHFDRGGQTTGGDRDLREVAGQVAQSRSTPLRPGAG